MKFSDMQFKSILTIAEKARLVTKIVDSLFDDEEYIPEIFEEQFWVHVASAYILNDDLEFTPDEFMDALYNQGLMGSILEAANKEQFEAVRVAVLKRIEMRLSKKPVDEFFEKAITLLSKLESAVDGIDLKGAIDSFSKLDINADLGKAVAKNSNPKRGKVNNEVD